MSVWFDNVAKRWRLRIRRGGREVARYLPPGITKQQAEEAHVNAMREFFDQTTLNKQPKRTIAEAITRYMEEHNANNKHPENAVSNARALLPFIRGRYLVDIGTVGEAIRAERKWAAATRNRRLALLRRVANLAYKQWRWIDRPISIELLPERNKRQVSLTPEQVHRLADAAGGYLPIAKDWIIVAAYSGMRQSEIATLDAGSVQRGAIHLRDTKNDRPRVVPVHPKARQSLARWIGCEGRPHTRWLYRQFERACADLGLGGLRFHDLRHFFASQLINAGVDLYTTGKILGHLDQRSTERYAHLQVSTLRRAVRRVK